MAFHFQSRSMSLLEVSAAVSVLLGFAPPASLSADGSSKVIKILCCFLSLSFSAFVFCVLSS